MRMMIRPTTWAVNVNHASWKEMQIWSAIEPNPFEFGLRMLHVGHIGSDLDHIHGRKSYFSIYNMKKWRSRHSVFLWIYYKSNINTFPPSLHQDLIVLTICWVSDLVSLKLRSSCSEMWRRFTWLKNVTYSMWQKNTWNDWN